jgi:hypothetical protein
LLSSALPEVTLRLTGCGTVTVSAESTTAETVTVPVIPSAVARVITPPPDPGVATEHEASNAKVVRGHIEHETDVRAVGSKGERAAAAYIKGVRGQ